MELFYSNTPFVDICLIMEVSVCWFLSLCELLPLRSGKLCGNCIFPSAVILSLTFFSYSERCCFISSSPNLRFLVGGLTPLMDAHIVTNSVYTRVVYDATSLRKRCCCLCISLSCVATPGGSGCTLRLKKD